MPSSPRSLSFSRTSHPRGEFQGQHLTRSPWWMPIGHEDHLGAHDARFPHSLVAGIEDEIGIGFLEKPSGQGTEGDIETRVDAADARDRKRVPTECFGDRMHLAGREPLHLYIPAKAASTACGSRSNHAVWRACSDPRNQKLELPDPRQPATFVVARPVALTAPPPLVGTRPKNSVISASSSSLRASFIRVFMESRSSTRRVFQSVRQALGFWTAMVGSLLSTWVLFNIIPLMP